MIFRENFCWRPIDEDAKAAGDVMLHLNTGHDSDGTISWLTVIGRWTGEWWDGSGLTNMGPKYWSPIPKPPLFLLKNYPKE